MFSSPSRTPAAHSLCPRTSPRVTGAPDVTWGGLDSTDWNVDGGVALWDTRDKFSIFLAVILPVHFRRLLLSSFFSLNFFIPDYDFISISFFSKYSAFSDILIRVNFCLTTHFLSFTFLFSTYYLPSPILSYICPFLLLISPKFNYELSGCQTLVFLAVAPMRWAEAQLAELGRCV